MSLRADSQKKQRKLRNKWKNAPIEVIQEKEMELLKEIMRYKEPTITGSVRITAGKAKNIRIDIPRKTRPLTDRMKTQIFDSIEKDIINTSILDLYAGSGSFGLEALSRGAKSAVFVDASKQAEKVLEGNIQKTGFLTESTVVRSKAFEFVTKAVEAGDTYEIIFIDPPYKKFKKNRLRPMEELLQVSKELLPGIQNPDTKLFKGVLILKHPRMFPANVLQVEDMVLLETFEYGMNSITLFVIDALSDAKIFDDDKKN